MRRPTLNAAAWWLWAAAVAVAVSQTTNPLVLLAVGAVTVATATRWRATDTPLWPWIALACSVIVFRLFLRMFLSGGAGATIIFTLPELPLPTLAAGITIGGPVAAEVLVAGLFDGMRLGVLLMVLGLANVVAPPRTLLPHLPYRLHGVATTLVVALSVAPRLIVDAAQLRKAHRLRAGQAHRRVAARRVVQQVIERALDGALTLATSMEARGWGARAKQSPSTGLMATLVLAAGAYFLLARPSTVLVSGAVLFCGALVLSLGLRTRADSAAPTRLAVLAWTPRDVAAVMLSAVSAIVLVGVTDPGLAPSPSAVVAGNGVLLPSAVSVVLLTLVVSTPALLLGQSSQSAALGAVARTPRRPVATA